MRPIEECEVLAISTPHGEGVAQLAFFGLYALQHRGQEAAGLAVSDGHRARVHKQPGLVTNVFTRDALEPLAGYHAIGHTRYSTTGASTWRNAQPVFREAGAVHFALGHNGNLTNTAQLADEAGMLPGTVGSDSDLIAELVARDVIGSGTVGTGCLLELTKAKGPWLKAGDEVELEIAGIGVLRNTVGKKNS